MVFFVIFVLIIDYFRILIFCSNYLESFYQASSEILKLLNSFFGDFASLAELEQILQRKLSEFTDCKRQLVEMEKRIESLVAADEANNKQQLNDIERLTKTCANLEKFNTESVNKSNTRIKELEISLELSKRFFLFSKAYLF